MEQRRWRRFSKGAIMPAWWRLASSSAAQPQSATPATSTDDPSASMMEWLGRYVEILDTMHTASRYLDYTPQQRSVHLMMVLREFDDELHRRMSELCPNEGQPPVDDD